ncbi:hypothetical protein KIH27_02060 [Mycobacterium sp. M1]|uniref:DUF2637 domain-containing protein n=1 Tax=Mycolicibacter acidiphilus TaxID=2835306 RepID=A0ABS5RHD5_9MYCO|nr:hypothetical protein [Mycolicibacter acidiphilus]MBS9532369.1 hypothetical protein [Mycolicibacter acidiphilus]
MSGRNRAADELRAAATAEHRAAFDTMRSDRRWMTAWLITVTALSIGGNVGSAVLGLGPGSTRTAGIVWAAVPPILLWWAVEGMPTLERMMAESGKDRILTTTTWAVVCGAFGWSAHGLYSFTVAVHVPPTLAWLAPLTIDLSIFLATRGLVKTAPQWARMKAGVVTTGQPIETPPAPARPRVKTSVLAGREDESTAPRRGVERAVIESRSPAAELAPTAADATPVVGATDLPEPSADDRATAQQIIADGVTILPVDTIAQVLAAVSAGVSQRKVADAVEIDRKTVGKVVAAAGDRFPVRTLTAVGAGSGGG